LPPSPHSLQTLQMSRPQDAPFDIDTYRILCRALSRSKIKVRPWSLDDGSESENRIFTDV
jgi:hypothetical protein